MQRGLDQLRDQLGKAAAPGNEPGAPLRRAQRDAQTIEEAAQSDADASEASKAPEYDAGFAWVNSEADASGSEVQPPSAKRQRGEAVQ